MAGQLARKNEARLGVAQESFSLVLLPKGTLSATPVGRAWWGFATEGGALALAGEPPEWRRRAIIAVDGVRGAFFTIWAAVSLDAE